MIFLEKIQWDRRDLRLREPWKVGTATVETRAIISLYVTISGETYYSEIAPLPGLHTETIEEAQHQLSLLSSELTERPISKTYFPNQPLLGLFPWRQPLLPSVQCGLELALWQGVCKPPRANPTNCTAIYSHNLDINGIKAIKWKIRGHPDGYISEIHRFLSNHPHIKLRLDGNRSLNSRDLEDLCVALSPIAQSIDYIEEPCQNGSDVTQLFNSINIPVAVDESLWLGGPLVARAQVLILKPSRLGGISPIFHLLKQHPEKRFVFSHCFESPMMAPIVQSFVDTLAPKEHHGIYTKSYFLREAPHDIF